MGWISSPCRIRCTGGKSMATKSTRAKRTGLIAVTLLTFVAGIYVISTYPCIIPDSRSTNSKSTDFLLTPSDMGSSWTYTSLPGQRKAQRFGRYHPDWLQGVELRSYDGYELSVDAMEFPCEAAAIDAMNDATQLILGTGTPTDSDRILKSIFGESHMMLVDAALIEDVSANVRTYCDGTRFPACEVLIQTRGKFFFILVNRSGRLVDRIVVAKAIEGITSRIRAHAEP